LARQMGIGIVSKFDKKFETLSCKTNVIPTSEIP